MLPFKLIVQGFPQDAQVHCTVSKESLVNELKAGEFDSIAVFEMVGEPFQEAMEHYVRQVRAESGQAITVVVLVEADKAL
jgi:hypothetical protein